MRAAFAVPLRALGALLLPPAIAAGCAVGRSAPAPAIAAELDHLSGPDLARYRAVFASVLDDALAGDAYVCTPSPQAVFFGDAPEGARIIRGSMPHYGVYFAPMHYQVRRAAEGWSVELHIAVDPPAEDEPLELADCRIGRRLEGASACHPELAPSDDDDVLCPASPIATAPATRRNVERLLAYWSTEIERYYNRDAQRFGLPIHYDFEFTLSTSDSSDERVDAALPLRSKCGRTPYVMGLDTGWTLPILAHEMGHWLGLLDEFENAGEMLGLGYKSPSGLESSRMGESRREDTEVLPLHHYLILRRYFCPEPLTRDPFQNAL